MVTGIERLHCTQIDRVDLIYAELAGGDHTGSCGTAREDCCTAWPRASMHCILQQAAAGIAQRNLRPNQHWGHDGRWYGPDFLV